MTYAESAKMNGRDDDNLTYEHLNISQYRDGSVLDCLSMTTYTAKEVVNPKTPIAAAEDVVADLRRHANTALTGVPAAGFECSIYPLEICKGGNMSSSDIESHSIYAETIEQAARYWIQFVTGKFNDNPAMRMLDGSENFEAMFEEYSEQPLTALLIVLDYDDATSGYVIHKNPKTNRWRTKGEWMREVSHGRKLGWRKLTAEELPLIGQGKIWRMETKWEKETSIRQGAVKKPEVVTV